MNKWLWSLLCVTLLGAAACSDDDTEGDSGNPIPPALSTENLPDAGLKFLYSALTPHTFTMNVDAPWEITKTAGWFVVTPNKGEAGQNIQVTVTPALNQGEARDGEFTIRANSGNNLHPCLTEKSIPLSQDAYLAAGIVITGLDERLLAFEAEDTDPVVFTVETSYDWTLTVENETWLTVAPKSGKAGSAAQVTITPKANTTDESILSLLRNENQELAEENSNKNTMIAATQRDYIAGEVSRDLTRRLLLPDVISKAHDEGAIHFHDADYFVQPIFNCCLINIGDMLDNGTVMNGKLIESPKSFQVACTVMTQIIACVASNQYGGQSVDLRHLGKYLRRSREKFRRHIEADCAGHADAETLHRLVEDRVRDELKSGVQTIQ